MKEMISAKTQLTGLLCPNSSVVLPTLGGSTITSYMIPINHKNEKHWFVDQVL